MNQITKLLLLSVVFLGSVCAVRAMDNAPLSGPFNRLASAMQPLFNEHRCVPEALDELQAAVVAIESVVRPEGAQEFGDREGINGVDLMRRGIVENNYQRIIAGYDLMLKIEISHAWGLLAPEDRELLRTEQERTAAEIKRIIAQEHPELAHNADLENNTHSSVKAWVGLGAIMGAVVFMRYASSWIYNMLHKPAH